MKTYTRAQMQKIAGIQAAYMTAAMAGKGIQEFISEFDFDKYELPDGIYDDFNVALGRLAKIHTTLDQVGIELLGEEDDDNE